MSYTWKSIVDAMKREAKVGVAGNYTEQYTIDCVEYINRVFQAAWQMNNWDFSKVDISITLAANTSTAQSLASTVGEIITLGIQGRRGELKDFTEKQYREWHKPDDDAGTGEVYGYINRGLDSSGNLKLLFVDTPTSQTVIEGQGKKKFDKVTVADVTGDVTVPYFPDKIIPTLTQWATGVFMNAVDKNSGGAALAKDAENKLLMFKSTGRTSPAKEVNAPPPDYLRHVNRKRGGTSNY